ncbi:MAG: hypothetical protein EBX59_01445 [Betaproteobacteria bacterium]|nr:hypothetical protein [Betaproteobacteria bacterium]
MLAVHLAAFFILCAIYRPAPDWLQRVIVGSLIAAVGVMCGGYVGTIFFDLECRAILQLGHVIEHLGVLLYVFRIFISDQEKRCLPNSSTQYQRLRD